MTLAQTVTNPANIIAVVTGILVFATIVTLTGPMLRRDTLDVRLKSVATRREELRRKSREAMATAGKEGLLRRRDESLYKNIVDRCSCPSCWKIPRWWTSWPRRACAARGR